MPTCVLPALGLGPAGLSARRPARQRACRVAVSPRAIALFPEDVRASQAKAELAEGGRLLPLLSDYLQARASVSRFERLAGRTAMVGAAVALATEALLPSSAGLFGSAASDAGAAAQFAGLAVFSLLCSAALAARLQRSGGPFSSRRLLEPTIASLTSKRRSFSGVTQINVDRAVDSALDAVLDPIILQVFLVDEEKYI